MNKNTQFKGDDLRKGDPKFQEPRFSQYLKCVERLQEWVQKKYHRPMIALAIRWALDKGISVALWGARNPDQLNEIETIFGWKLTPQDFQEIDQIVKETVTDPDTSTSGGPPNRK
jgi:aryl-alcohol dehydrogenase-like predicted oxidoreductase